MSENGEWCIIFASSFRIEIISIWFDFPVLCAWEYVNQISFNPPLQIVFHFWTLLSWTNTPVPTKKSFQNKIWCYRSSPYIFFVTKISNDITSSEIMRDLLEYSWPLYLSRMNNEEMCRILNKKKKLNHFLPCCHCIRFIWIIKVLKSIVCVNSWWREHPQLCCIKYTC